MKSLHKVLSFITLCSVVSAQTFNVTVNETDTSQITFGGGAGDALLCKVDEEGNVVGGQPGCYNVQPQPPCTEFAAMGQQNTSFASWKFKGSALYITSLLNDVSPLFNVDIDGNISEVDGAQIGRDSKPFTCFNLFLTEGLDSNVEHTVNLTVKGRSPNSQSSTDETGSFSLISYTYTASNNSVSTSTNSSASNSTNPSGSSDNGNGSERLRITQSSLLLPVLALYFWFS
ncbi:hypothetical protein D9758_005855 [Tetrapyrgos nigripes]|uniref:Uncharacterized protein n=1 Tax=Tetrapyrgos nigripes TaxID=182062 RepID=A0A8H5G2Z2_9AGAR|nr:hypothetical protein D9758_005855 [Tetrapyrgos nigripes]